MSFPARRAQTWYHLYLPIALYKTDEPPTDHIYAKVFLHDKHI